VGIKHALLKGMALEYSIYGGQGLRQMNDNDILVSPEDSIKAWEILKKEGFLMAPLKSRLFRKFVFNLGDHLPALSKDGYTVEIHTNLSGSGTISESGSFDLSGNVEELIIDNHKALMLKKDLQLSYLINHFEKHVRAGDCQLRLFADIVLLGKDSFEDFPEQFIAEPIQSYKKIFRKAAYKATIGAVEPKYRLRFIIGDMFPSVRWMMKRHNCNIFAAGFYYPRRIAKLLWLL
jgi:hypothetical protein